MSIKEKTYLIAIWNNWGWLESEAKQLELVCRDSGISIINSMLLRPENGDNVSILVVMVNSILLVTDKRVCNLLQIG